MVILNYGGPDRSIKTKAFEIGPILPRRYRNRRLDDFLKELDLTEGKATGIPIIRKSLKINGSPDPEFDTDEERSYFQVTLHIHPDFFAEVAEEEGVNDLLTLISENPGNRVPFFADKMNVPTRSIERWLKMLREENRIEF